MQSNEASKLNPLLKPFAPLIGEWALEGSHPYIPNTTLHGQVSFGWIEGGAFVVMRTKVDEPKIPSGISIFGSDDVVGEFFILYFDERCTSRKYDVSIKDNIIEWHRTTPEFSQRFTLTIAQDSKTMEGKGTMRKENQDWEDDIQFTYKRIS